MADTFYVGPVDILSGLVKFPITSIEFCYRLWDFGVGTTSSSFISLVKIINYWCVFKDNYE